jgi:hypothetical protein
MKTESPILKRAMDYIANTGGSPTIAQFDDDHEPVGPRLRDQLKEEKMVFECEGRIYSALNTRVES